MRRPALHLLSALTMLVLGVVNASACTCGPPSDALLALLLRGDQVILFGQAISRQDVDPTEGVIVLPDGRKVLRTALVQQWLVHQVAVSEWFSGADHPLVDGDRATVTIHTEHPYRSSCGFQLTVGTPMMFIAQVTDGRLVTHFCPNAWRHVNDLPGARDSIARARRLIETQVPGTAAPR